MAGEPLYLKVAADLAMRIDRGDWTPGSFIPSEADLERRYRVSRTTIRKAVDRLVDQGLVTITHGLGTRVTASRLNLTPATLMSFTQMMRAQGTEPGRAAQSLGTEPADAEVAAALELEPGTEVLCYRRVRTADGEPVSTNVSYLPLDIFGGFDPERLLDGQSLYDQLAEAYRITVQTTQDSFGIGRADAETASQLETRLGEPLLIIARTGHDPAGRPIEYSRIAIRTDRYRHTITLRRKP